MLFLKSKLTKKNDTETDMDKLEKTRAEIINEIK